MMGLGAGELPAGMPCPGELADQCAPGLQCCDVSGQVPGMLPLCKDPGECATLILKIGCEQGGGTWADGGCRYPTAPEPAPPPVPTGPAPTGPAPSVPGPPAAKPTPAAMPTAEWWKDPLVLGAGVALVGIVAIAATRKKKKAPPAA
jgi:hypothetical protein